MFLENVLLILSLYRRFDNLVIISSFFIFFITKYRSAAETFYKDYSQIIFTLFIYIFITYAILTYIIFILFLNILLSPIKVPLYLYRKHKLNRILNIWLQTLNETDRGAAITEIYLKRTLLMGINIDIRILTFVRIILEELYLYKFIPNRYNINTYIKTYAPKYFIEPLYRIKNIIPNEEVIINDLNLMMHRIRMERIIYIINYLPQDFFDANTNLNESLDNIQQNIFMEFNPPVLERQNAQTRIINNLLDLPHIRNLILQNEIECVICKSQLTIDDVITQCGHMFHAECLSGVINNKCPKCRYTL